MVFGGTNVLHKLILEYKKSIRVTIFAVLFFSPRKWMPINNQPHDSCLERSFTLTQIIREGKTFTQVNRLYTIISWSAEVDLE